MRTKLLLLAAACVLAAMSPAVGPATRNPVAAAQRPNAKLGLASYALKSIRPAPVMPDQMLPTILVPFTATLREGAPPL